MARLYTDVAIGVSGGAPGGALADLSDFLSFWYDFSITPQTSGVTEFTVTPVTPVSIEFRLFGTIETFTYNPPFVSYSGKDADNNLYLGAVSGTDADELETFLQQLVNEANQRALDDGDPTTDPLNATTRSDAFAQLSSPITSVFYNDTQPANTTPSDTTNPLPVCFGAGTPIATPDGERRVEDLAIGDGIFTADGRIVRVKWIGRQTFQVRPATAETTSPVRIAAGALGDATPHTDLTLTADHALLVDGRLVNAGALVNGTSIVRVPASELPDRVTYYHVETEDHDVILAAGAPAETFVDNVTRARFDNYAEFVALYGVPREGIAEIAVPRVMSRRQLPATIRTRLAERAAALGLSADTAVA